MSSPPAPLPYERPLASGEIRVEPFAEGVRLVGRFVAPRAVFNALGLTVVALVFLTIAVRGVARLHATSYAARPLLNVAVAVALGTGYAVAAMQAWRAISRRGGPTTITATADGVEVSAGARTQLWFDAAAVGAAAVRPRHFGGGHRLTLTAREARRARSFRLARANQTYWREVTLLTHADAGLLQRAADAINAAVGAGDAAPDGVPPRSHGGHGGGGRAGGIATGRDSKDEISKGESRTKPE